MCRRNIDVGKDQAELVAAETRYDVVGANAASKAGADGFENLVSRRMSGPIVDRLETVEIEQCQHVPPPLSTRRSDGRLNRLVEGLAIRQARQRIVRRCMVQSFLELMFRCRVTEDDDQARISAIRDNGRD
jgi:hypothetical protein